MARFYRVDLARNEPVSNEITGYAASTYAWLYRTSRQGIYLEGARRTARFLLEHAWNPELETFPFECAAGSPGYFFDCGIIVRGLLAVWRLTGDTKLLDVAGLCGRSMARDYLTPAAIHPVISLPDRKPLPYERRWSREPGCFQLKASLAWRDLWIVTRNPDYLGWWESAWRMALASASNFLPGADDGGKVMDRLHAYSYFLEALLSEPGRPDGVEALRAGIERVGRYLREIAPRFARSDVHAQLLRVRLLAASLGLVDLDRTAAEQEAAAIPEFQYHDPDPALDGAFCFGTRTGQLLPYANPVSTAFCAQALDWWRRHLAGHSAFTLDDLI